MKHGSFTNTNAAGCAWLLPPIAGASSSPPAPAAMARSVSDTPNTMRKSDLVRGSGSTAAGCPKVAHLLAIANVFRGLAKQTPSLHDIHNLRTAAERQDHLTKSTKDNG